MVDFNIRVIVDTQQATRGITQVNRNLTSIEDGLGRIRTLAAQAFAFAGLGVGVGSITRLADSFTNLQNRLRVVTDDTMQLTMATEGLLDIANRTRSSFESTVEVFSRVSLAAQELGLTQSRALAFTEGLNQAVILSGASAIEAEAGLIQLSQGLASGALRGDELRSVLEQLPIVADVIAQELGVTRGALRELGAQGAISAQTVIRAFERASDSLAEDFGRTVPTLSQSLQVLRNNFLFFIGDLNQATGLLDSLSRLILSAANNLETTAQVLASLTIAAVFNSGAAAVGIFNTALRTTLSLLRLLRRALLIGFAIEAIEELVDRYEQFNAVVRTTPATIGDAFRVAADVILNNVINIFELIGRFVTTDLVRLIVDTFSNAFAIANVRFLDILTGNFDPAALQAAFGLSFNVAFGRIADDARALLERRLLRIASDEELQAFGFGPQRLTEQERAQIPGQTVTAPEPSIFQRFGAGFTDEIERASNAVGDLGSQFQRLGQTVAEIFGPDGTLVQGIADGTAQAIVFGESFGSILANLGRQIVTDILSNLLRIGLNTGLGAVFGGGGGFLGGLFGGAGGAVGSSAPPGFSPIPAFANGGSFMVGPNTSRSIGGVDNRFVAFRARDGERVTVSTPGQQAAGGAAPQVTNTFNIDARGMSAGELNRAIDTRIRESQRIGGTLERVPSSGARVR